MYYRDSELAIGTAFFYLYEGKSYLITNWHNVTGREPDTLKCKSKEAAIPTHLQIRIPYSVQYGSEFRMTWRNHTLPLYEDEGDCPRKAVWYEHPQHRHKVDVVALPLGVLEESSVRPANDPELDLVKIILSPGLDVFVLGFPKGMSGGSGLPVWKRGSIASEPSVNVDDLPKIFIDTATREGMSGSPVYAQRIGYWTPEDVPESIETTVIGQGRRFLGIYSGRVGNDTFLAQLGVVWKPSAIEEIIQAAMPGQSSFEI